MSEKPKKRPTERTRQIGITEMARAPRADLSERLAALEARLAACEGRLGACEGQRVAAIQAPDGYQCGNCKQWVSPNMLHMCAGTPSQ